MAPVTSVSFSRGLVEYTRTSLRRSTARWSLGPQAKTAGLQHTAPPLVGAEVAGGCQADERAVARVAGVDDQVFVTHPCDPRVFDPELLRVRGEVRQHVPVVVDDPVRETVGAPCHAQVGDASACLDTR